MKVRLSELADDIFTGLSTSGRAPVGKGKQVVCIINVRDLVDGEIVASNLDTVVVEAPGKVQRYMVQANDVLITTRGTLLKSAVVSQDLAGSIISSNLAVIRLPADALITPILLQAYLESSVGQQKVFSRSRTTTLQLTLTSRDVGEIEVPVPDWAKQKSLEALSIATKQYIRLEKQALETRIRVSQQLFAEAFSDL